MQAFNMFDSVCKGGKNLQDKSGKIDANEIRDVIGEGLSVADAAIWNQMIKDVDVNGDGQIDFDEFLKMMYTLKDSAKYV